jgi:tetratricopeptide (TPR) repeat protein
MPTPKNITDALSLGQRLLVNQQFELAVDCYHMIAGAFSEDPRCYLGLARAHAALKQPDQMIAAYKRTLVLQPDVAGNHASVGNLYYRMNRPDLAAPWYRRGLLIEPNYHDISVSLGMTLLQLGDWKEGWRHYHARDSRREFDAEIERAGGRIWRGDPAEIQGKSVLVMAEQGMGDNIQFSRYATWLSELGARVILCCHPDLAKLLDQIDGVSEVVSSDTGEFDYACTLLSLAYWHGTTRDTVPHASAYIHPPPAIAPLPGQNDFKVGVVWTGNPQHTGNTNRSCPTRNILQMFDTEDTDFFILQRDFDFQKANLKQTSVYSLAPEMKNFEATSRLVNQLDLVISIDTSIAHLAASIGRPTWLMLGRNVDWRWLRDGDDTPWYDSVRLFRMAEHEDWEDQIGRVITELDIFRVAIANDRNQGRHHSNLI